MAESLTLLMTVVNESKMAETLTLPSNVWLVSQNRIKITL